MPEPDEPSRAVEGFWFVPAGEDFNDSAAIHTQEGLRGFFEPHFRTLDWERGGLDGFQDEVQRVTGRAEVRGKAALVPHTSGQPGR